MEGEQAVCLPAADGRVERAVHILAEDAAPAHGQVVGQVAIGHIGKVLVGAAVVRGGIIGIMEEEVGVSGLG